MISIFNCPCCIDCVDYDLPQRIFNCGSCLLTFFYFLFCDCAIVGPSVLVCLFLHFEEQLHGGCMLLFFLVYSCLLFDFGSLFSDG